MKTRILFTSFVILLIVTVVPSQAHIEPLTEPVTKTPAFIYISSDPIIITQDSDFIVQGFPGNGTQDNPYLIEGLNITASSHTITISNTSVFFEIRYCILTYTDSMTQNVLLEQVQNAVIRDSMVLGGDSGILIHNSAEFVVENTTVCGASIGVDILSSSYVDILNNVIHSCNSGIIIDRSSNCSVIGNSVYENPHAGIVISWSSSDNTIYDNLFGHNGFTTNPLIHASEAIDFGVSTSWDNGLNRGNNWTNFDGNGTYVISRNDSVDNYPSVFNYTMASSIVGPANIVYVEGTTGHELQWNVSDRFPTRYEFYINEELNESGWWIGTDLRFNLDGLSSNVYNITLAVYNIYGNRSRDLVVLNVLDDLFGGVGTEYVLIASLISVVLVVIVIFALKRYL